MKIFAAYGSTKDVSVYASIGLPPSHIYIVGRPTKKMQHQCQVSLRLDTFKELWVELYTMLVDLITSLGWLEHYSIDLHYIIFILLRRKRIQQYHNSHRKAGWD